MGTTSELFKHLGGVPVGTEMLGLAGGDWYFLDPTNGNDSNDGRSPEFAFASLPVAYAALTANQHDVLVYIAGTSSISLDEAFTWAKSYTHFIGVAAPSRKAQRARIFQDSAATGLSPLITISASGCMFSNFYVFQGVNDATSLIEVLVSGSRNYFSEVHFAGGGHTAQAINGGASLNLQGSENVFERCTIGVDTIAASTGLAALLIDGTGCARNEFIDCRFTLYAAGTTPAGVRFVEVSGNTAIDRYTLFERCIFVNLAATAVTTAISFEGSMDANNKRLLMKDCAAVGAADWDSGNTGVVYLNNGTITGGGNAGLFAVSNST